MEKKFIEELREDYHKRYGIQRTMSDYELKKLKEYLHEQFICFNETFVTIYICNGGGVNTGFPLITTKEKYTIHSAYRDFLLGWLKLNGFKVTLSQLKLGDNECPPAHGGWIPQTKITKISVSSEGIV